MLNRIKSRYGINVVALVGVTFIASTTFAEPTNLLSYHIELAQSALTAADATLEEYKAQVTAESSLLGRLHQLTSDKINFPVVIAEATDAMERLTSIMKGADAIRENELAAARRAITEAKKIAEATGASYRVGRIINSLQARLSTALDRTHDVQDNAKALMIEFSKLIDTVKAKEHQRN
jgi:hypothetical protein